MEVKTREFVGLGDVLPLVFLFCNYSILFAQISKTRATLNLALRLRNEAAAMSGSVLLRLSIKLITERFLDIQSISSTS